MELPLADVPEPDATARAGRVHGHGRRSATGSISSTGAARSATAAPGVARDPGAGADRLDLDARRATTGWPRRRRRSWRWTCVATGCRTRRPRTAHMTSALGRGRIAVAEGAGSCGRRRPRHRRWARVRGDLAAEAAARLGERCAGALLVDGGWESLEDSTGVDVDEFLRGLDEPPEVLRSIGAYLADRKGFDPTSWDADQERAARATVVETHAGRVVPAARPHATEASVRAMFTYDPIATLQGGRRSDRSRCVPTDDEGASRARRSPRVGRPRGGRPRRRSASVAFEHDGAQPDALPSARGRGGDPRARARGEQEPCRSSTARGTWPRHRYRDVHGRRVPANEVAERAERIRSRSRPTAASGSSRRPTTEVADHRGP